MKSGFVRALWGIYDHQGRRFYKRRTKHDKDIKFLKMNPYKHDFTTYVFGEDNYKYVLDQGFNARLLDKRPIVWDMDKEQFRHKLEVFDKALEDFDEIVFLDWDTLPVTNIPENFWEVLHEKDAFQATLIQYRRKKAYWRKRTDTRKLTSASFVYCRDKTITSGFIKMWENIGRPWSEELAMSKYIDSINGGWKDLDFYWDHHEPYWFALPKKYWAHDPDKIRNEKKRIFHHFDSNEINRLLNRKTIVWENSLQ